MEEKSVNRKRAKKHAQLKEFWRRYKKNKAAVVGLVILCVIVGIAVFADLIVPDRTSLAVICLPVWYMEPVILCLSVWQRA